MAKPHTSHHCKVDVINLGSFSMSTGDVSAHINHVCKTTFDALHCMDKVRTLLDNACIEKLVHAFISSRLDYCNSILYGCPFYEIQKLKSVQHARYTYM